MNEQMIGCRQIVSALMQCCWLRSVFGSQSLEYALRFLCGYWEEELRDRCGIVEKKEIEMQKELK